MFVMTAKVSKTKIAAIFVLLIALAVLAVMLLTGKAESPEPTEIETAPVGDSNDARVSFLTAYGWDVNAEPMTTQQVTVPEDSENETFRRYNALQVSQGFDLTKFAGKTATRYVYELLNYPDAAGPVYATLFVCEGQIIGGDITDTGPGGKMCGFQRT